MNRAVYLSLHSLCQRAITHLVHVAIFYEHPSPLIFLYACKWFCHLLSLYNPFANQHRMLTSFFFTQGRKHDQSSNSLSLCNSRRDLHFPLVEAAFYPRYPQEIARPSISTHLTNLKTFLTSSITRWNQDRRLGTSAHLTTFKTSMTTTTIDHPALKTNYLEDKSPITPTASAVYCNLCH